MAFYTVCIIAIVIGLELFQVLRILWLIDPRLMAAAMAGIALLMIAYVFRRRARNRRFFLAAKGFRSGGNASHADMINYGRFLVNYCHRLVTHRLLTDQQAALIAQKTNDVSEAIQHHPLNDDLQRAIVKVREDIIGSTFKYLDGIGVKITESKARAAIQDLYQPPFPVIAPLVVFYHQFTLIAEITDTYIPNPSLREYIRVIRDVWELMTKGDFLRYGQRLFSGINSNPYSLGRAGDDLGQAFSIIWLTHAVSRAATLRCCTLHDWNLQNAVADMQANITPCLSMTRETLLKDALPILKERIRHYTPVSHDPTAFVEEITASFVKSVDAVVLALSVSSKDYTAHKTSPGLVSGAGSTPLSADVPEVSASVPTGELVRTKVRRRRRHRVPTSRLGILIQRIVYMGQRRRH